MTRLLLDTCAIIWMFEDGTMGEVAQKAIDQAWKDGGDVAVSVISAWEIGMLAAKGRVTLSTSPARWFGRVTSTPGVRLLPLDPEALIESSFLPGAPPPDPMDRILIATARAEGGALVTRDRLILGYSSAGHVQSIPC